MDKTLARYARAHRSDPDNEDLHLRYLNYKARAGKATPRDNRQRMILIGEAPSFLDLLMRCTHDSPGGRRVIDRFWFKHTEKASRSSAIISSNPRDIYMDTWCDFVGGDDTLWLIGGLLDDYKPEIIQPLQESGHRGYFSGYGYCYMAVPHKIACEFMRHMWLEYGGPYPESVRG